MKKQKSNILTAIVDPQTLFVEGLRLLLKSKPEVNITKIFSSAEELLKSIKTSPVDLIILSLDLPKMSGLELVQEINQKYPNTSMLVLSQHKVVEYCRIAIKRGATGYLLKEDNLNQLSAAIDTVIDGKEFISSTITSAAAKRFFASENTLLPDVLTKSEKLILKKITSGLSNKEIAKEKNISVRTVETHRAHILKKLKIKNTANLVRYAMSHHLVDGNHSE